MSLDDDLRDAHECGDKSALVGLYTLAAERANTIDEACFFLTQAYIFALDDNHAAQNALKSRLRKYSRI